MSIVPVLAAFDYKKNERSRVIRKRMRDTTNPFDIEENKFMEKYSLPINLAKDFIEEIREVGNTIETSQRIPLHLEILVVLNFLANGSFQNQGSDALKMMCHQKTLNCVRRYATLIAEKLTEKYVRFPQSEGEIEATKASFFAEYGFPHVIGVIDTTQIGITAVRKDPEHAYINWLGYYSLNTQLVCDNDMKIINCNAKYAGSTEDNYIWDCSESFAFLQLRYEQNRNRREWLIGDNEYRLQPFLLTEIRCPLTNQEDHYNRLHRQMLDKIGKCIGLLKTRFRCMLRERKLRYEPSMASNIIMACVVLHNILIMNKVPYAEFVPPVEEVKSSTNNERDLLFEAGNKNRNWVVNVLNTIT